MYWGNANLLFGLWLLPVVGGLLVHAHRKRAATARRFADPAMVARLMPAFRGARPWLKGAALLVGLACLIVAAARPRFGVYFEKVSRRGVELLVLLDVSRSMLAEDVAPSRLERAKSDILDLLAKLEGDRVGLIAFAGRAVVKAPLTSDQGFFRMALAEVGTHSAPRGGSLIGDAIRKALEAMKENRTREQLLLLITDGEDHDSFPQEAAEQAAERNVRIIAVGLGDPGQGARIPVQGEAGGLAYLKYKGHEVWSKMDERLLEQLALTTGGVYVPARTLVYDLGEVYEEHVANLRKGEHGAEKRKRYRERFQLFVCLGLGFLLFELLLPAYPLRRRKPGI